MSQVRLRHTDNQTQYVPKRLVAALVQRLRAEWVIYGVLARMLPETVGLDRLKYYGARPQEESKFPSSELPGLSFMLRGRKVWDGTPTRDWLNHADG